MVGAVLSKTGIGTELLVWRVPDEDAGERTEGQRQGSQDHGSEKTVTRKRKESLDRDKYDYRRYYPRAFNDPRRWTQNDPSSRYMQKRCFWTKMIPDFQARY